MFVCLSSSLEKRGGLCNNRGNKQSLLKLRAIIKYTAQSTHGSDTGRDVKWLIDLNKLRASDWKLTRFNRLEVLSMCQSCLSEFPSVFMTVNTGGKNKNRVSTLQVSPRSSAPSSTELEPSEGPACSFMHDRRDRF